MKTTVKKAIERKKEADRGVPSVLGAISRECDCDVLTFIAQAPSPVFARQAALRRLEEIHAGRPLEPNRARMLMPCLSDPELAAFAVSLFDRSGYDWCLDADERVRNALRTAHDRQTGILERIVLEDALDEWAFRHREAMLENACVA